MLGEARLIKLLPILFVAVLFGALQATPVAGRSLIRDAEVENTIRTYATPIFSAAGLDPGSVRIHLIAEDELNAFVAGGQRLFVYTGLLIEAQSPGEVIGVIAHEAGHIAGGHLARIQEELRNAEIKSLLALVLGAVAGAASGDGRVAGAVIAAGQGDALGGLLKYSRTQESAADAAGMKYLDATGQSSQGIYDFLQRLESHNFRAGVSASPYLSTHPLTAERIDSVANHLALSRYSDVPQNPDLVAAHDRIRAKLIGFTRPLGAVLSAYPESDLSVPARYARAIVWYRQPDLARATALVDGLIADEPENPYFHELKGQMLLESGRVRESLAPYRKMVELAPDEPLLEMALAKAQLETNEPALTDTARQHLESAVQREPQLGEAWRLLTVAYSRLGQNGETALAQAEYSMLQGERAQAKVLAARAADMLPRGSPGWLRAQDIVTQLEREKQG
jgi:predicted Zn-dependent protease